LSAATAAYAAFRVTPQTALTVADKQADVARAAVEVAGRSAEAAFESAAASLLNAKAATRTSENQGIHSVARLRQEWINELRGRVAQAHALLSNRRRPSLSETDTQKEERARRTVEVNEILARIELLLNPKEEPSKRLHKAIQELREAGGDPERQKSLGQPVIVAAQEVFEARMGSRSCRAEGRRAEFGRARGSSSLHLASRRGGIS
jgi:hypothetical protein